MEDQKYVFDYKNEYIKLMVKYSDLLTNYNNLVKKVINYQDKNTDLLLIIKKLEDSLIDEFSKTLLVNQDYNFESDLHYRNGLRFTLDYIQKEKDNGTI